MKSRDQERVEAFLRDLVKHLAKKFGKRINFILLIGSAARGEFKRGISDVDLIIEVKDKKAKGEVEDYLEEIFWKLDEKHGTMISNVCKQFSFLSKETKLYTPYEVIVEGEINWKEGKLNKSFGLVDVFIPKAMFAAKIKEEGKILYGKDIRKEINVKPSLAERIKLFLIPPILSFIALLVALISPNKGVKLSLKALFSGLDDHLFALEGEVPLSMEKKIKMIKRLAKEYSPRLLREAMDVRLNFFQRMKEWTYLDKISFSFDAFASILLNNFFAFLAFLKSFKM